MKLGRKDPCPCGSGKKYKRCCFPKFGTSEPEAAAAPAPPAEDAASPPEPTAQPRVDARPNRTRQQPEPRGGKPLRTGNGPPAQVMMRKRAV